jgi:hypothetical protein
MGGRFGSSHGFRACLVPLLFPTRVQSPATPRHLKTRRELALSSGNERFCSYRVCADLQRRGRRFEPVTAHDETPGHGPALWGASASPTRRAA